MSKPRRDSYYLADIHDAIRRILEYTQNLTYEEYLRSRLVQDAVLRNFQVIGEAAKKLSPTLLEAYPTLPWRAMAGMRDRIVHDYFGINHQLVWSVVCSDLPSLLDKLDAILRAVTTDEAE